MRRIYGLLHDDGFTAIITTNSIIDGDNRKGRTRSGAIAEEARRSIWLLVAIKWPGAANLIVSLLALHKGEWDGLRMLDDQQLALINAFFEEGAKILRNPPQLS